MNLRDYWRAIRLYRAMRRRERAIKGLRHATESQSIIAHVIRTTDSAARDYCAEGRRYGNA
jgi:hypothetical protein